MTDNDKETLIEGIRRLDLEHIDIDHEMIPDPEAPCSSIAQRRVPSGRVTITIIGKKS